MESSFLNPTQTLEAAKLLPDMKVADLGCGSGFFTRAAARLVGHKGVVWAVDANSDLLARIKNLAAIEKSTNVEVVRGDLEQPSGSNLPSGYFDFCILTNVLFSAENKEAVVREVSRVLKTGGLALVVDWRDSFGGLGPHPGHVISVGAARDVFEKVGLQYVEDIPAGDYHWGFVVQKK